MSLHKSLKRGELKNKKNVLNRIERIKDLIKKGKWKDGDKVLGLPKTKIIKMKKIKTEKETKEVTVDWDKLKNK